MKENIVLPSNKTAMIIVDMQNDFLNPFSVCLALPSIAE